MADQPQQAFQNKSAKHKNCGNYDSKYLKSVLRRTLMFEKTFATSCPTKIDGLVLYKVQNV